MQRSSFVALLLCLLALSVQAAIPLCDYQSPLTNLSNLTLNFSYQFHNDPYGLEANDVSQGQFGVDYVRLFDSPEYGFDVALQNDMMISAEDLSTYTITADTNYKRYFVAEQDIFAFAGASIRSSSSFLKLGLSFSLGVGSGRFTDVTPLAKATRIVDFLVNRGSLSDQLHPEDLKRLALEIGSEAAYDSLAELLEVVQAVIEDSRLVARVGGLDALDISEITRFIQEDGFARYCGWDLKIGLGYELLDPSGGANDLLLSGAFNYALATTPKAQFLIQGSVSGAPEFLTTHRMDFTGSYDYLISNLLSVNASYDFARETWGGESTDKHRVSLEFVLTPVETAKVVAGVFLEHRPYFLEWSMDVSLSIQMDLL